MYRSLSVGTATVNVLEQFRSRSYSFSSRVMCITPIYDIGSDQVMSLLAGLHTSQMSIEGELELCGFPFVEAGIFP
jgi:hypothetical protein